MNLREFLNWAEGEGRLTTITREVSPRLEMARIMHGLEGRLLLFSDSRQDAAHQARFIIFASRYDRMRRRLVQHLEEEPGLSIQRAVELLSDFAVQRRDNPHVPPEVDWIPEDTRHRIQAWEEAPLLDEIAVNAGYRATLLNLGLVGIRYHQLDDYVQARGTQLTEILGIELIAAIFDSNREDNPDALAIDAASTSPPIYGVAPGETVPFDFDFWGPLNYKTGSTDLVEYYAIRWDPYWTWTSSTEYVPLSTNNDIHEFDDYGGEFTGQVVNDTDAAVDGAVIIVNLYSKETGELVITGYDSIYDPIEAGDTAIYEVYLDTPDNFDPEIVDFEIVVKGELP